ncbi:MAG: hypothetical protein K8F52_04340 [Candidatus Scalindua rubra]|uniref:DUF202 domain-containing protein n=1 Tax=Candidatus Scalindua brodae TaxID=237368 RepID=A0A0B0ENK8_9BACT|nr:MAG: hypothetical protein SCABRO_00671 [Candidatus Scalindua brodae]MBZ0107874.1 hypothetical protein [Candidatus Scalindua rubra]TWU29162.1 hypothetical protein S225a_25360 [Candidatus Brocadiaceae bacterium S225]
MNDYLETINKASEEAIAKPVLVDLHCDHYQAMLSWIRTTITILVPSLALLIGLQEKNLSGERIQNALLLISMSMMTLSILLGLWALLHESKSHANVAEQLKRHLDAGKKTKEFRLSPGKYSLLQIKLLKIFPWLVGISILSLGSFGFVKYWQF